MSFCGSREGSLSVKDGVVKNECFVDILNIIPHGLFIVITGLILIAWRESIMGKLKAKTWVHFPCHSLRWILTLLMMLSNGLEIAEGFLSDNLDPDSMNYHAIVPPWFFFVSTILSIIFYHNIEMWNSPRFLLIMMHYWAAAGALKLLKAFSLYASGIELQHLKMWVIWVDLIIYTALFAVELVVLFKLKYALHKKPVDLHPHPELENTRYYAKFANFLSKATFWWISDVLLDGYKTPLSCEKLGKLPVWEKSMFNYRKLACAFESEKDKAAQAHQNPSFHKVYFKAFWPMLLLAAVYRLSGDLLAFVGPWCIENIVDFVYEQNNRSSSNHSVLQDNDLAIANTAILGGNVLANISKDDFKPSLYYVTVGSFSRNGYGLCVVLFVATILQHTLLQNHHYLVIRQGVRLRSAIQTMVYTKALKLSSLNLTNGKMTSGQIMNHMSMDANFLMMMFFFLHYVWATPVQVALAIVLLYFKLGISALLGGLVIVLSAPVQIYVGRGMSEMQKKVMHQADVRVKQCNEMIQGIKVIKLLAWECYIAKNINESRARELKYLFKNAVYRAIFTFIGNGVPILATLLTFILYPYIEDEPLTAGKALSTLALFNILTIPLVLFSVTTSTFIMANVSVRRLLPYFMSAEVKGFHGYTDSIKTRNESLVGEADNQQIQLQLLVARDKHDELNASTCSLASHHSVSSKLESHYSSSSLMEFGSDSHSQAIVLSVNMDHHHSRCRHPSGRSIEDADSDAVYAVEVDNGSFSWNLDTHELTLKNINVHIPIGKLTMIIGSVGSGKSSLLSAILGEMLTVSGQTRWLSNTHIAYVAQKPWLLNKTLKDNILFGNDFLWKRYQKVIEACALQPDIDCLPAGDLTEIGEKGINLSGGQKQRVSIARALYSSADTIIMDDPFSALDAHVGRHVFDDVILKKLMRRKKTVILVTQQLQYLSYAHCVLVMKDGEVECQGKLSDIKKSHPELYESWRKALKDAKMAECQGRKDSEKIIDNMFDHIPALRQFSPISDISHYSTDEVSNGKVPAACVPLVDGTKVSAVSGPMMEVTKKDEGTDPKDDELDKGDVAIQDTASGKLVMKEHREIGAISLKVYMRHLMACGIPFVLLTLLLLLLGQALTISTNVWISAWAGKSTIFMSSRTPNSTEVFDNRPYMHVYLVLSLMAVTVTLFSGFAAQFTGLHGARNLHNSLLKTVMRLPVRFFEANPSGRILNRFSSDIGQIDQKLPATWESYLRCIFATLSAIIVNCIGTPYFILAAVPLCILYAALQKFYTQSARDLQRLDSVTKSPIFSHTSETLNGLHTIRAYRVQSKFRQLAVNAIDNNVLPFIFNLTANRWLGIRLDYMGAVLVFASAVASLSAGIASQMDPAFVGLCIVYTLMVSNYMNWIVRNATDLEMMMSSVERVEEYTNLETEFAEKEESTKESGWPTKGEIILKNVSLSYDLNQDPVVRDVSFVIEPGEKIGICGRTGSGKSSLSLSLFRLIEIVEGEIDIDGRNIMNVALPELRSKLAIIPQDPTLFTGSIRYNLDPTGQMDDSKLWMALESVQLKDTIEALPDKLDSRVSEGGDNFSIGQKQLFCLARAFLRENKILVLDEATASIDLETDNKLQTVIWSVFKCQTVITIAHRISTIMKYDRVMTMENGRLLEFDKPQRLLEQENSHFAQLVRQSYR